MGSSLQPLSLVDTTVGFFSKYVIQLFSSALSSICELSFLKKLFVVFFPEKHLENFHTAVTAVCLY